ncbi:T9SS type A sorting domain-containing protein [bacterium]|nr:T9SS type A sorting domain-containing protein [bacterium]
MVLAIPGSAQNLKIAVIRVAFQIDDSPATTGDGSFVIEDTVDLDCPDWVLDPPPHDKTYFLDHLRAADNYWQRVSNGNVSINLASSESMIFPAGETEAFPLPHDMLYYHPYLQDFDETAKLFELSRDALNLADSAVNFNDFSTVIVVHAGMGGDFAFALDPTPGNIPSAYLTASDFSEYGELVYDGIVLKDLIIIPESQNFLQYKETRSLFTNTSDPCFYQVGLNGTLALMLGFHLGLPPLYNTESGMSLVGGFALMDQGSNNFHGIAPAYPDPYTRIREGWISPNIMRIGDNINLTVDDDPIRISISDSEYYLIENRQRNLIQPAGMTQWIDVPGFDTVSVDTSLNGVVLQVDEQHAGLPGNGLYIWHIDESAWYSDENPNGGDLQLVDFVEADGAQDMGHTTQLLFAEYLETGWWFDPWFATNEGWFHLNRTQEVVGDSLLSFNSSTFPSTLSNSGIPSHLSIENISKNGSSMSFSISSDREIQLDSVSTIIGLGQEAGKIWCFNTDSSEILVGQLESDPFVLITSPITPDMIYSGSINNSIVFQYPWLVTQVSSGIRFMNMEDGIIQFDNDHQTVSDITLAENVVRYIGYTDSTQNLIEWNIVTGGIQSEILQDHPLAFFTTTMGTEVFYGNSGNDAPKPVAVSHVSDHSQTTSDGSGYYYQEAMTVIGWNNSEHSVTQTHLPDGSSTSTPAERPDFIIPLDTDNDGAYEITLFYADEFKIINQVSTLWNGNPVKVDPYFGTPLIIPFLFEDHGIFLRHSDHYGVYSITGELLDQGVLPLTQTSLENVVGYVSGHLWVIQSGNRLLKFEKMMVEYTSNGWYSGDGRPNGDRTVILHGEPATDIPDIKSGSAYNYPNPIKGSSTTIRAWIGEVDTWSVEIFSLSGAQIKFFDQDVGQNNAYNELIWDAGGVSNGVYLAQVVAGEQSEIIKIAIIR